MKQIIIIVLAFVIGCKNENTNMVPVVVSKNYDYIVRKKPDTLHFFNDLKLVRGGWENDSISPISFFNKKFKIDFNEQSYFGLCYDTLSPIDVLMDIDIQGQEIKNIPVSCNGRDVFISKQINWEKVNPVGVKVRTDDEQKLIKKNLNDLKDFIQKTNQIVKPKAWRYPGCG
jgi:hypothetical protein